VRTVARLALQQFFQVRGAGLLIRELAKSLGESKSVLDRFDAEYQ
jgi:hypothetical protein